MISTGGFLVLSDLQRYLQFVQKPFLPKGEYSGVKHAPPMFLKWGLLCGGIISALPDIQLDHVVIKIYLYDLHKTFVKNFII